jgi:hypothetical protein
VIPHGKPMIVNNSKKYLVEKRKIKRKGKCNRNTKKKSEKKKKPFLFQQFFFAI